MAIATITLQAKDWAWLIGKNANAINSNAEAAAAFRAIRDQIRAANPANFTTNVTITNLPEWVAMAFYRTVKTGNAGEIVARYTAITAAFESKAELTADITAFNATMVADFERVRDVGKYIVMDA